MEKKSRSTTENAKDMKAGSETLYRAFTNPEALAVWLAPGEMTGKVHSFDLRVGGGYTMSLFYPAAEKQATGKTTEKEDRFTVRFTELNPNKKIVQAINFDAADPAFAGTMTMEITLKEIPGGTKVTILFTNIPPGIRPEDNEAGTKQSLEKLALYTEKQENKNEV